MGKLTNGIMQQPNYFSGFQTWIGYVDVKSSPVYFYVQRNADFNATNTPITFNVERLNVGEAMNLTSGKFTAPWDGIYSFSFTGTAWFPASSSRVSIYVAMYLNGNENGSGVADEDNTSSQYETFSFQSALNLKKGAQIWLEIFGLSTGAYLRSSKIHFSGYLMEEKIAESLKTIE